MATDLKGKRIAFLFTDGVEQVELTQPLEAVRDAGADADLVSLADDDVRRSITSTRATRSRSTAPSPTQIRRTTTASCCRAGSPIPTRCAPMRAQCEFVRAFFEQDKPVGVICHGPWTLVEAGVLKGRTITSWPSLQTDIRNAGANWVDEEVHTDNGLVSSRKPDDLPAFCSKIVEEFAEGKHPQHVPA